MDSGPWKDDRQVPREGLQLNANGHGGTFVHPRDGSIRWPAVRRAIDEIGYSGFLTIEDGGLPYPEFSRRLDLIIAGE